MISILIRAKHVIWLVHSEWPNPKIPYSFKGPMKFFISVMWLGFKTFECSRTSIQWLIQYVPPRLNMYNSKNWWHHNKWLINISITAFRYFLITSITAITKIASLTVFNETEFIKEGLTLNPSKHWRTFTLDGWRNGCRYSYLDNAIFQPS